MKTFAYSLFIPLVICLISGSLKAQPTSGVYMGTDMVDPARKHEVKIRGNYLIYTEYSTTPEFLRTRGGFYSSDADSLRVELEFNSDFEQDAVSTLSLAYRQEGEKLILNEGSPVTLQRAEAVEQDLDGAWLFATRGPDTGQERRGDSNPRKTLKFLMDGYFQWIAYNTETMRFSGSGGGRYTASDGKYTEVIQFFSRDNTRVGAELEFNYELKGDDWHHTGKNSRGEPMYEIWSRR
jgi:hypothetical protein